MYLIQTQTGGWGDQVVGTSTNKWEQKSGDEHKWAHKWVGTSKTEWAQTSKLEDNYVGQCKADGQHEWGLHMNKFQCRHIQTSTSAGANEWWPVWACTDKWGWQLEWTNKAGIDKQGQVQMQAHTNKHKCRCKWMMAGLCMHRQTRATVGMDKWGRCRQTGMGSPPMFH